MNTVKVYLFLRLCHSSLNFNFVVLCKEIPKTKEIMGHQASAIRGGSLKTNFKVDSGIYKYLCRNLQIQVSSEPLDHGVN